MGKTTRFGVCGRLGITWLSALAAMPAAGCGQSSGSEPVAEAPGEASQALTVSGTWTALPANNVTGSTNQIATLLTDGSLLFQSAGDWRNWSRFTPDSSGNYATGTWSSAASSPHGRLYYPYATLKDGRFLIGGGEYLSGTDSDHAAVEIYDPLTNVWQSQTPSPLGDIGDVAYQVLADGRIIMGYRFGAQVEIFDPTTGSWSVAASKLSGSGTEETWSLLPAGTVLNWATNPSQLYLPATNQWINAAAPPVTMQNPSDLEIGAAVFMPNGKLLALSAFGNGVLYTPGATASAPGSWTLGPSVPPPAQPNGNPNGSQYAEDVPACIEVDGKVLLVSSDQIFGFGNFSEYDPVSNTITAIAGPSIPSGQPSYLLQFVALPSGQILLTGTGTNDYLYTPTGTPSDAWRPAIQSISANVDGSYTLSGTQLNGVSQGASYGDEGNAQTNYPLVRLTSGSTVRYARTYAFSTLGFATGSAVVQTRFTLPPGIPVGTYQLSVVTNGIASVPVSFDVGQAQNLPPQTAITSPAAGAMFTAPAVITINATATDPDGTISKVEFYNGSTLLGTDTTAPYSFVWSNVPVGGYALTAKAYDNLNLATTSAAVSIGVNAGNLPPSTGITAPANNATFSAPAQIAITANAADPDGTISKVEFYNGSILLGTDTTSPYGFNWANVAAGSYALTTKAYDNLNLSTTSAPIAVTVTSPPPITAITSPANNATFTAPAQVTINATASDPDGTVSKVEFYRGTTLLGTDTTSPYNFSWSNVAAGSYALTTKAYDNLNQVTTSATVNIVVGSGNQFPSTAITSPVNNATFTAPAQVTINATATDADGSISKVEFYNGSTLLGTDTTSPYSFNWANVAAGSYALTSKAYDNLNAASTSAVINIVVSSGGLNPCANLCTSPTVFTGPNYQSGSVGSGAVCRETTSVLHAGNCSEMFSRSLKVNGTTMSCGQWTLPPPRNGGYCVQVTAGSPTWSSFATW